MIRPGQMQRFWALHGCVQNRLLIYKWCQALRTFGKSHCSSPYAFPVLASPASALVRSARETWFRGNATLSQIHQVDISNTSQIASRVVSNSLFYSWTRSPSFLWNHQGEFLLSCHVSRSLDCCILRVWMVSMIGSVSQSLCCTEFRACSASSVCASTCCWFPQLLPDSAPQGRYSSTSQRWVGWDLSLASKAL